MTVCGVGRCAIGVLGAGGSWRTGWLGTDPALADRLSTAANDFTRRIAESDPPTPGAVGELAAVKAVFADDDGSSTRLTAEHARIWDRLKALRKRGNSVDAKARRLETSLRYAVALHRYGLLPDGRRLRLAVDAGGGRRLVETTAR